MWGIVLLLLNFCYNLFNCFWLSLKNKRNKFTFFECLASRVLLKVNRLTAENWLLLLLKIVCSSSDESSPSSVRITSGASMTSSCCKLLVSSYSLVSNGSGFQDIWIETYFSECLRSSLLVDDPNGICPSLCKCWRSLNSAHSLPLNLDGCKVRGSKWS